jgi:hypothetical protein
MPIYRYRCPANGEQHEVVHRMGEEVHTWGELCARAGVDPGDTAPSAPVERLLFPPNVATSAGLPSNAELASKGFTKLVRREKGVYENVTARPGQPRYVSPDD